MNGAAVTGEREHRTWRGVRRKEQYAGERGNNPLGATASRRDCEVRLMPPSIVSRESVWEYPGRTAPKSIAHRSDVACPDFERSIGGVEDADTHGGRAVRKTRGLGIVSAVQGSRGSVRPDASISDMRLKAGG